MTNMSTDQIKERVPNATVVAANEHTWAEMLPKLPSESYGTSVVLLGYNDILRDRISQDEIEQMMRALKERSSCVVAIVPALMPTDELEAVGVEHRAALEQAGMNEGVAVTDRLHDEWYISPNDPLTIFDGVHPSEAGKVLVGENVAAAADICS